MKHNRSLKPPQRSQPDSGLWLIRIREVWQTISASGLSKAGNWLKRSRLAAFAWQKRAGQSWHRILKALPAVSVVLVTSTLILYLTVGPAAGIRQAAPVQTSGGLDATDTVKPLLPYDASLDQFEMIYRGSGYLPQDTPNDPVSTDIWQDPENALPSETSPRTEPSGTLEPVVAPEPTVSPVPTATPVPLETDVNGVIQEPLAPLDFTPDESRVYVRAFEANIRSAPRTDADIVTGVTMGDQMTRTGYGQYWSEILLADGRAGYVLSSLISTDVIYKPAPTATPTPRPTAGPTRAPAPTAASVSSSLTAEQKQAIVDLARSALGVRYVYGGASMSGFDCSGLTTYIYKTLFGITLPRTARDQAKAGKSVSAGNIQIGDIICFDWDSPYGVCDHVGIYIGNGQYIHAAHSRGRVVESTVNFSRNPIVSIRRIIP